MVNIYVVVGEIDYTNSDPLIAFNTREEAEKCVQDYAVLGAPNVTGERVKGMYDGFSVYEIKLAASMISSTRSS